MTANTYVALSRTTLASNTTTVTISGIDQTYTDLVVVIQGASSSGTNGVRMRINGDTGTNYSTTFLSGTGSSMIGGRESTRANMSLTNYLGITTTLGDIYHEINFLNYANTDTYKTAVIKAGSSGTAIEINTGYWRSSAAINSISFNINTFGSSTGDFIPGSTFSVYGIRAEGVSPAPKATGGAIYSDSTYYYHVFGATGTFTPLQSLSVDYAIIAGGAGARFGGGGAGGFRAFTGASLSATGYTATVGAGGAGAASGTSTSFNSNSVSGGGYGSTGASNGISGGSGGGAGSVSADPSATGGTGNAGSYSPVEGYAGGNAVSTGAGTSGANSGGGGGAGGVGGNGTNTGGTSAGTGGAGGVGAFTYNSINISSWLTATGVGVNGYVSAGGAGGGAGTGSGSNGAANSGNGAVGSNWSNSGTNYNGGSGVVIVRYVK